MHARDNAKMLNSENEILRKQCWDKSFHAHATSNMFIRIAKRFRMGIQIITYLGVIVPVIVGVVFISFSPSNLIGKVVITVASISLACQLVISIWSIIAKWDDKYSYALESIAANNRISLNFKTIAENPPSDMLIFQTKYELLKIEDDIRNDLDSKQLVSEKDKRYGHRAALRQFNNTCRGCNEIPYSLEPTNRDVCGNF